MPPNTKSKCEPVADAEGVNHETNGVTHIIAASIKYFLGKPTLLMQVAARAMNERTRVQPERAFGTLRSPSDRLCGNERIAAATERYQVLNLRYDVTLSLFWPKRILVSSVENLPRAFGVTRSARNIRVDK